MEDKKDQPGTLQVLVAARNDVDQRTLKTFAASLPGVEVSSVVGEWLAIDDAIERVHPSLILLEWNLFEDRTPAVIMTLRQSHPGIQHIVLVQTEYQQQQARAAGAKLTLLIAEVSARLPEMVERSIKGVRNEE